MNQQQQTTRFYGPQYFHGKSGDVGVANTTCSDASISTSQQQQQQQQHREQNAAWYTHGSIVGGGGGNVINTRKYFREVYGPFLCSLLLTSAFLVILGSVLMLAGFYVPTLPVDHLEANIDDEGDDTSNKMEALRKAKLHNNALSGLRISGVVLLAIGVVGLTVLFLTPIVCLRRTEYALLPDSDDLLPRSSFSSAASGLPENMFTFSVVKQHIQPRQTSTKGSGSSSKTRTGKGSKQRSNYDKGFLSPELNRGPIFVSDDNFSLQNDGSIGKNRIRSSSFDSRLSPRFSSHKQNRASRFSPTGRLTPEVRRSLPVKAGSFHSLR